MGSPEFGEKAKALPYYRGVWALLKLVEQKRANHLRLLGPVEEGATAFDFLPVYPPRPSEKHPRVVPLLAMPKKYIAPIYELILRLNLPDEVSGKWSENPISRLTLEKYLVVDLVPSVLLTLGRTETEELVIDLFALPGISQQTALTELKQAANSAQAVIASRN